MVTATQTRHAGSVPDDVTTSLSGRHRLLRRLGALEIVILLVGTVLVSL